MTAAVAAIRRYGARCLRRRAEPVDPGAPATTDLRERLWTTLAADGGVGLAAPQIGEAARVVVIRDPGRKPAEQRLDLVNPEIVETFGPQAPFDEGCLSFPGLYTTVLRPQGVVVEHDTDRGRVRFRDDGLVARIVQHEIDHLDGVLFIDHLSWGRKIGLLPRLAVILATGWLERTFGKGRRRR